MIEIFRAIVTTFWHFLFFLCWECFRLVHFWLLLCILEAFRWKKEVSTWLWSRKTYHLKPCTLCTRKTQLQPWSFFGGKASLITKEDVMLQKKYPHIIWHYITLHISHEIPLRPINIGLYKRQGHEISVQWFLTKAQMLSNRFLFKR